jgi:hypothetical protein
MGDRFTLLYLSLLGVWLLCFSVVTVASFSPRVRVTPLTKNLFRTFCGVIAAGTLAIIWLLKTSG